MLATPNEIELCEGCAVNERRGVLQLTHRLRGPLESRTRGERERAAASASGTRGCPRPRAHADRTRARNPLSEESMDEKRGIVNPTSETLPSPFDTLLELRARKYACRVNRGE